MVWTWYIFLSYNEKKKSDLDLFLEHQGYIWLFRGDVFYNSFERSVEFNALFHKMTGRWTLGENGFSPIAYHP